MKKLHRIYPVFLTLLVVSAAFMLLNDHDVPTRHAGRSEEQQGGGRRGAVTGQQTLAHVRPKGLGAESGRAVQPARYGIQPIKQGKRATGRYIAANLAQRLTAHFTPQGVQVSPVGPSKARWTWGLQLRGYGYGQKLQTPGQSRLVTSANRIEYRRGALTEWYHNDQRGLEQGFTIAKRPPVARPGTPLQLALTVRGSLHLQPTGKQAASPMGEPLRFATANGLGVLDYSNLRAWDAQGRHLPVRMKWHGGAVNEIELVVDDGGAAYPVTIDPLIAAAPKPTLATRYKYKIASSGEGAGLSPSGADDSDQPALQVKASTASPTCTPPPSGLMAWWRAEGDVNDSVGPNHGVLEGGATFAAGKVGQAFSLDGNDDAVHLPQVNLGGQFSADCWIYATSGAGYQNLLGNNYDDGGFGTLFLNSDHLEYSQAGGLRAGTAAGSIPLNQWAHVALTYDGATVRLYINGNLAGAGDCAGNFNNALALGWSFRGDAQHFAGLIDEVDLFNRALSAAEVLAIAGAADKGKCTSTPPPVTCVAPSSNLVAWWHGEDDVNDSIGPNHGVLEGGATFAAGKVGQAFSLDGNDDAVHLPQVNLGGQFSADCWIYATSGAGYQNLLGNNYDDGGFGTLFLNSDHLEYSQAGGLRAGTAAGSIPLNQWAHVALTYDGATVRLYINGNLAGAGDCAGNFNNALALGWSFRGDAQHFAGLIDEVDLFNRALTIKEVRAIVNAGGQGKCTSTPPPVTCTPPPSGLVSWWRGAGSANDSVGPNHGVREGGATFAAGKVGQAFSLDGNDDAVHLPQVNLGGQFSADCWIYATSGAGYQNLLGNNYDDGGFGTLFLNSDHLEYSQAGGLRAGTAAGSIPLNQWAHVALTYDGATVRLYINGNLAGAGDCAGNFNNALALGWSFRGDAQHFAGLIDEVDLFNRALTPEEVHDIVNASTQGKCRSATSPAKCTALASGLVSWWEGEDNANDNIGPNQGILQNGATFAAGKVGRAFSLDGGDDFVDVPSINLGPTFTLDCWIRATSGASYQNLLGNNYDDGGFGTLFLNSDHLEYSQAGGLRAGTAAGSIPLNQWAHVALTYDGTTVRLYINGNLAGAGDCAGNFNNALALGWSFRGDAQHFAGLIDEVDLFNRALAPSEIQAIVNAGSQGKCASALPALSINSATVTEGNSGTTNAVFTVSLSAASSETITVNVATANGTAVAPGDYTAIPTTTLTFAPGETSKTVTVPVKGDTVAEPNETFLVNLSKPTKATIADAQGVGTIISDDKEPDLRVDAVTVQPSSAQFGQAVNVTWTVRNVGAVTVTPNWSDRLSLSTDVFPGGGDTILLTRSAVDVAPLAPGDSYTLTEPVTLPLTASLTAGDYYILATADSGNTQLEVSEANNTAASNRIALTVPPLPNLRVTGITPTPAAGFAGQSFNAAWTVKNEGDKAATGHWVDRVYLSSDNQIGDDTLLGTFDSNGPVAVNASYTRSKPFTLPGTPGQYWIIVTTDAASEVEELTGESNNTLVDDQPIQVSGYSVSVQTDVTMAVVGTPVPVTVPLTVKTYNAATNAPVPNVSVSVRILHAGTRRLIDVVTDATGQATPTFQPLPNEAGHYDVAADRPSVAADVVQDQFNLVGMSVTPNQATHQIVPGVDLTGQATLQNLGDVALSGLTASVQGAAANLTVTPTVSSTLPASGATQLSYKLHAADASVLRSPAVLITVTSAQGATAVLKLDVQVAPLKPQLVSNPGSLLASMLRGSQQIVQFDVSNLGGAASGDLDVLLPGVPWLSLASAPRIASLAPGDKATVILRLSPSTTLQLGHYKNNIVVKGATSDVSVPFDFTAVSDLKGSLRVTAVDEYTYYVAGAPKVANATVTLSKSDPATGLPVTVASGVTNAVGELLLENIKEGYYDLSVRADKHSEYRATILVNAAQTQEITAFMSRRGVTYTWIVKPTEIPDHYTFELVTTFETNVPIPVITIDPPSVDLTKLTDDTTQIDLTITNHGLIASQGGKLTFGSHPLWKITPLVEDIGTLAAKSSVVVPTIIQRLQPTQAASLKFTSTHQLRDMTNGGSCGLSGGYQGYHECGGQKVSDGASVAFITGGDCQDPPVLVGLGPGADSGGDWGSEAGFEQHSCSCKVDKVQVKCKDNWVDVPSDGLIACKGDSVEFKAVTNGADETINWGGDATGTGEENTVTFATEGARSVTATCGGNTVTMQVEVLKEKLKPDDTIPTPDEEANSGAFTKAIAFESIEYNNLEILAADPGRLTFDPGVDHHMTLQCKNAVDRLAELVKRAWPCFHLNVNAAWGAVGSHTGSHSLHYEGRAVDLKVLDSRGGRDDSKFGCLGRLAEKAGFNWIWYETTPTHIHASVAAPPPNPTPTPTPTPTLNTSSRLAKSIRSNSSQAEQEEGVCAIVKLQLNQDAVITRSAFIGTLEINNGSTVNLEQVKITLDIRDANKQRANSLFGIKPPQLTGLTAVDGTGIINAASTGRAEWTIIPNNQAAPDGPTPYTVGGTLSYVQDGQQVTVPLYPAPITVMPDPRLHVKYFWQRDVYSDDPFTDEVEPAEPFDVGLMMTNLGKGTAKNVTIISAQPKIIENKKGLLIDFQIIGSQVGKQPVTPSLTANLGAIEPAQTAVARWLMTSSLQGKFIDYQATYQHIDDLGDNRLSLIDSLKIYELIHTVRADVPTDDEVPDFLATPKGAKGAPEPTAVPVKLFKDDSSLLQEFPDTGPLPAPEDGLHKSNGSTFPVNAVTTGTVDAPPVTGDLQVHLTASLPSGWAYLRIPDPAQGNYRLVKVLRSDGREVLLDWNAWTTHRTKRPLNESPYQENLLHIFDFDSTGSYTLEYALSTATPDSTPPVSAVAPLPPISAQQIPVQWSGQDEPGGSGLAFFDVFVSVNGGRFTRWLRHTHAVGALYPGVKGSSYAFYSVATDFAGNVEAAPPIPDAATTVKGDRQPDLFIKKATEPNSAFAIGDTYQPVPAGNQIEPQTVNPGGTVAYHVKVQNDSATPATFVVKASESSAAGWTMVYKVGVTGITAAMHSAGGYTTGSLAPGASEIITVEMTPGSSVRGGTVKRATVQAFPNGTDTTVRDAVQAATTLNVVHRPDALIKQGGEASTAFALNNVYQQKPAGDQIEAQTVAPGVKAAYQVKVQNDGNTTRSFVVKALESSATGWTVVYKAGTTDISAALRSAAGYTTANLAPGASQIIAVEMTPGNGLHAGAVKSATLNVQLAAADTTVRDAVRATTTTGVVGKPDALIKRGSEAASAFAIDNVYQASPAGDQIESQAVNPGGPAVYQMRVQNDGNTARGFVVKTVESSAAGWTVVYKSGTTDISAALRDAGGYPTASLAPGASQIITVAMTPGSSVPGGTGKSATLKVFLDGTETMARDAVKAVTTANVVQQTDALIKQSAEDVSAYALDNVYQTAPSGAQIETQTVAAGGKAVYHVQVQNDGNTARSFVVKATESSAPGWTLTYKLGTSDISAALRSAGGYTTTNLTPGASQVITLQMAPVSGLASRSVKTTTLKVFLDAADTMVRDAVKANASVP